MSHTLDIPPPAGACAEPSASDTPIDSIEDATTVHRVATMYFRITRNVGETAFKLGHDRAYNGPFNPTPHGLIDEFRKDDRQDTVIVKFFNDSGVEITVKIGDKSHEQLASRAWSKDFLLRIPSPGEAKGWNIEVHDAAIDTDPTFYLKRSGSAGDKGIRET